MIKKMILLLVLIVIGASGFGICKLVQKKAENEARAIIARAEASLENKEWDAAMTDLDTALEKTDNVKDEVLAIKSVIFAEKKDLPKLTEIVSQMNPKSESYSKAILNLANLQLKKELYDEASANFEKLSAFEATKDDAEYGMGAIYFAREDYDQAKIRFDSLLKKNLNKPFMTDLKFKLGKINYQNFMSGKPEEEFFLYTAQKGDILFNVCNRFKVSVELTMKLNNMLKPTLYPNKRLLIPKTTFSLIANKATHTMELHKDGQFFKIYRIRTGREAWLTPEGKFQILNKVKNPKWTDPKTGKAYAPGDPENELGTRWMAFVGGNIGIHGTIHPETIGTNSSNGCIGMLMEDVEELYELVPIKTDLTIISGKGEPTNYENYEEVKN